MKQYTEAEVTAIAEDLVQFAHAALPQMTPAEYVYMGFMDAQQRLLKQANVMLGEAEPPPHYSEDRLRRVAKHFAKMLMLQRSLEPKQITADELEEIQDSVLEWLGEKLCANGI